MCSVQVLIYVIILCAGVDVCETVQVLRCVVIVCAGVDTHFMCRC